MHDGYGYLMQEFGIDIAGVVEPAHGLVPSAQELGTMVDLLKREKIPVVFSEESFPEPLLKVLRDEGGAHVYIISHIASGAVHARQVRGRDAEERRRDGAGAGDRPGAAESDASATRPRDRAT